MRIIRIFIAILLPPLFVFIDRYYNLKSSGFIVSFQHGLKVLVWLFIFTIFISIINAILMELIYSKGLNPRKWKSVLVSMLLFLFLGVFSFFILDIILQNHFTKISEYIPLTVGGGLIGLVLGFCNKALSAIFRKHDKNKLNMRWEIITVSIVSLAILGCIWWYVDNYGGKNVDVAYESSDGFWTDSTDEMDGRNFKEILFYFESYRLKANKPDVTLVRVTPIPIWLIKYRNDLKWKVPYTKSSGKAQNYLWSYTDNEATEIKRRSKIALDYWEKL